jgi:hypothetical protein
MAISAEKEPWQVSIRYSLFKHDAPGALRYANHDAKMPIYLMRSL